MAVERVSSLWRWAGAVRRDVFAVALAVRDARVGWPVRALALLVAAYALSPIDLIPDFIPVLGLLDDLILLPLGIWLIVRLVPPDLMDEFRARAEGSPLPGPSRLGAALVVLAWVGAAALCLYVMSLLLHK